MRLASQASPFNLVVTNVPGPPTPLYLLGARMLEAYPLVPLFTGQALGIALFSNAGKLFWGFNADWDALPDFHDLVGAVTASFAELQKAAGDVPHRKAGGRTRPRRAEIRRKFAAQLSDARANGAKKPVPTKVVIAGRALARKSLQIRRRAKGGRVD
jgi:hypothetical protein